MDEAFWIGVMLGVMLAGMAIGACVAGFSALAKRDRKKMERKFDWSDPEA